MKTGPLAFIGGTGRCGSSLLLKLLKAHPAIEAVAFESNPCPASRDACVRWLREHVRPLREGDHEGLIVEKTPANIFYAERLLSIYPQAKYVHMARGRDRVIPSILRMGNIPMPGWGACTWETASAFVDLVDAVWHETSTKRGPRRTHRVVFEELILAPTETLGQLTQFLGVDPFPGAVVDSFHFDRRKL